MDVFSRELPMELVTLILERLPVKSLVRFMCVCKAWCSLVSSPRFASLHFDRYHNNNPEKFFLAANIEPGNYQFMLLSSRTYKKIVHDDYTILNNRTIMSHVDNYHLRGSSVNGLILLSKRRIIPSVDQQQLELINPPGDQPQLELIIPPVDQSPLELMLWNPMIGKIRILPAHDSIDGEASLGFGFSHSRSEYLVVAISRVPNTSVNVYSLSTGTWKSIVGYNEDIINEVLGDGCLVVDGVMYFVSVDFFEGGGSHMVLYNMNDEIFSYIKLPCLGSDSHPVVYREKVGLLDLDFERSRCNLWVMGKDGKLDPWRKLYTIRLGPGNTTPQKLVFKENGELLIFIEEGKVVLYNFESKRSRRIRLRLSSLGGDCFPYKESLLLLD